MTICRICGKPSWFNPCIGCGRLERAAKEKAGLERLLTDVNPIIEEAEKIIGGKR